MKLITNAVITFAIGFVAGISPFLFMYLLPELLSPSQAAIAINVWCVLLTGILIGAITCILFAKKVDKDPGDVFFAALGIPAILIGAVTNLSTTFSKEDIQKTASHLLLEGTPVIEEITVNPSPVPPSGKPEPSSSLLVPAAWAAQAVKQPLPAGVVKADQYFVVIGQYPTKSEADGAFLELSRKKLNTEKYWPKNLTIFSNTGNTIFYLSYSSHASENAAVRVYRLLKLNDPELAPRIVKQGLSSS